MPTDNLAALLDWLTSDAVSRQADALLASVPDMPAWWLDFPALPAPAHVER